MIRHATAVVLVALALQQTAPAPVSRSAIADRVMKLTRASPWKLASTIPVAFPTYHPQGMVKIGETLFVSSVEIGAQPIPLLPPVGGQDRGAGAGVGHLFKMDTSGKLISDLTLGEGTIYHPGGIDYDGRYIWVPVAEYRPDSKSIIYRVDPDTMKAQEVFRVADHIGAIVHDTDDGTLHGVSWGSRRFYRWTLDVHGRVTNAGAALDTIRTLNPSHYIDYQDCKYAGGHRMLCTGVTEIRGAPEVPLFRLGGMDLVDLRDSRPLHQVPILLWTQSGFDMTHNPVWIEGTESGLRGYFMPEDNTSTLYIYDVTTQQPSPSSPTRRPR